MTYKQQYAEKLRDPRWEHFRQGVIRHFREELGGDESPTCFSCESEATTGLQVHHLRYINGREPWEYDFEDVALVCDTCHKRVHRVARAFHDWLISLEPSMAYEASDLLDELLACANPRVGLARCKSEVRHLNHRAKYDCEEGNIRSLWEIAQDYAAKAKAGA